MSPENTVTNLCEFLKDKNVAYLFVDDSHQVLTDAITLLPAKITPPIHTFQATAHSEPLKDDRQRPITGGINELTELLTGLLTEDQQQYVVVFMDYNLGDRSTYEINLAIMAGENRYKAESGQRKGTDWIIQLRQLLNDQSSKIVFVGHTGTPDMYRKDYGEAGVSCMAPCKVDDELKFTFLPFLINNLGCGLKPTN